jgi:hypothetical protein
VLPNPVTTVLDHRFDSINWIKLLWMWMYRTDWLLILVEIGVQLNMFRAVVLAARLDTHCIYNTNGPVVIGVIVGGCCSFTKTIHLAYRCTHHCITIGV